jgi:predicted phosphodiesterase
MGPALFCGDPHGQFRQVLEAAVRTDASAVILLGDMEPERPLQDEMRPLTERGVPWVFIGGNHDTDSDDLALRVWNAETEPHNVHGRVVTMPGGLRVAGLAGVFRESVWYPSASAAREGAPTWRSRSEHARSTPRQDRWLGRLPPRRHLSSIYPDEFDRLADMRADVLISHEAPGYHPNGVALLDDLARAMGVKVTVHGHHHDALDSSSSWKSQGFRSRGVGLRGVSALHSDGRWEVVVKGEQDDERTSRYRVTWP